MKTINLLSLNLKNFKGVREFSLVTNGESVKVFGDNATGKTTLFDSFVWLLFDKDSQNKKDFSIKTLVNGKEQHKLEHEVEGVFSVNGTPLSLRKVYNEKWTKKRGSATQEFTGHEVNHFIDGVPVKKKEYTEQVASLVDEEIFKLLTSPTYFNEQLHWQKRRETLLDICGDITDQEVIESDGKLSKLPDILQGRTIENHRKIIASRRAEINKELDKIPVRIDEIQRNQPEIEGLNLKVLGTKVNEINTQIDDKLTQISDIRNGKAINEKQKAIQEIDMQLMNIKQEHESGSKEQVYQLKAKIQEEQSNISILKSKLNNLDTQKRNNDTAINNIEMHLGSLRNEWADINAKEFKHEAKCECPACGQSLPEEQVEAVREKALAQFNSNKSNQLESINEKGRQGKADKERIITDNENIEKEYKKIDDSITEKELALDKLQNQLKTLEESIIDITEVTEYKAKLQEKQSINQDIQQLRNESEKAVQEVQTEITNLKQQRDEIQKDIAKFTLADQAQARINELDKQERELAAEFENLEQELFLTEEFIRTKVNLLEEKINSMFEYARFNLFKTNINGGLEEICETTFKGVPYSSGLNNAARINVGLDIINTLSKHYGILAPIFIDNSEAVTSLIPTEAQTVSLIVNKADKALRVESKVKVEAV